MCHLATLVTERFVRRKFGAKIAPKNGFRRFAVMAGFKEAYRSIGAKINKRSFEEKIMVF
jgi:hypothetical protein